MTPEEWAVTYVLQFGAKQIHQLYTEGEREFIQKMNSNLGFKKHVDEDGDASINDVRHNPGIAIVCYYFHKGVRCGCRGEAVRLMRFYRDELKLRKFQSIDLRRR